MISKCPSCNTQDSLYDRTNDYRCVQCGSTWSPKKIGDSVPTRPYDTECGDVIPHSLEGCYRPLDHVHQCNDGTQCSFDPRAMKQLEDGRWLAVCSHHKE